MTPQSRLQPLEHPLDKRIMPPQQMMLEIAAGMEHPENIAKRYGFTVAEYQAMAETPYFQQQVVHYEAELRATGVTFARKAAMLAEDLLVDAYQMAKASDDHQQVLETAKWLAKMGRLEPATTQRAESPSGNAGGSAVFQLSINLGGSAPRQETITVDAKVVEVLAVNRDLGTEDAEGNAAGGGITGL